MFCTALNYVTLRLLGESINEDGDGGALVNARKWILDHGGVTHIPSWGKLWLSVSLLLLLFLVVVVVSLFMRNMLANISNILRCLFGKYLVQKRCTSYIPKLNQWCGIWHFELRVSNSQCCGFWLEIMTTEGHTEYQWFLFDSTKKTMKVNILHCNFLYDSFVQC